MTLLRKYSLWLLLATLAGIAGAWLIYASLPVRYVSTAEVDIEPTAAAIAANWAPNMITEQQVATSGVVLTDVTRAIGIPPGTLAGDLSATVSGTSATGGTANVLSINCAMPTAIMAQRCSAAAEPPSGTHIGRTRKPSATPPASARNDSSVMTGIGGRVGRPLSMDMPAPACVIPAMPSIMPSMPACAP